MKGLRNAGGFWRISSEHMSRTGLSHMDKKWGMRSRGGLGMLSILMNYSFLALHNELKCLLKPGVVENPHGCYFYGEARLP